MKLFKITPQCGLVVYEDPPRAQAIPVGAGWLDERTTIIRQVRL